MKLLKIFKKNKKNRIEFANARPRKLSRFLFLISLLIMCKKQPNIYVLFYLSRIYFFSLPLLQFYQALYLISCMPKEKALIFSWFTASWLNINHSETGTYDRFYPIKVARFGRLKNDTNGRIRINSKEYMQLAKKLRSLTSHFNHYDAGLILGQPTEISHSTIYEIHFDVENENRPPIFEPELTLKSYYSNNLECKINLTPVFKWDTCPSGEPRIITHRIALKLCQLVDQTIIDINKNDGLPTRTVETLNKTPPFLYGHCLKVCRFLNGHKTTKLKAYDLLSGEIVSENNMAVSGIDYTFFGIIYSPKNNSTTTVNMDKVLDVDSLYHKNSPRSYTKFFQIKLYLKKLSMLFLS